IESRVAKVPLEGNNYSRLAVKNGFLIYSIVPTPYYGRQSDGKSSVRIYSIKERKETTLMEDAANFTLSQDGSKLLVRAGNAFTLMDATAGGAASKKAVSTANLYVDRVPAQEWSQIFDEVWRRYRDFFYAPNM